MLNDFDSRSQLPERICDRELMGPWFDSMHDCAAERQHAEISRR
jgi:hypothetical protein